MSTNKLYDFTRPTIIYFILLLAGCTHIDTFIPQGGQVGSEIEIIGNGFSTTPTDNTVTFGTQTATVLEASANRLVVTVPNGVIRSKIKVSRNWLNNDTSDTDYIPLPDYLVYQRFKSTILKIDNLTGLTQGYWIMYPPGYHEPGKKFPIIYALHGANFARNPLSAELGNLLNELNITNLGNGNEHSWLFGLNQPGIYFPFIAYQSMQTQTVATLRSQLHTQLSNVAGSADRAAINELIDSILYYFPRAMNSETELAAIDKMIIVMPDGDNSWYTDRLGPAQGRNNDGIGAESSFPTVQSNNPAGRFDLHVTGWYEKYFIQELLQLVENNIGEHKLVAENKRRFIMGISMGGYGSLKLALKHQDKFVAAASLSASGSISSANLEITNNFVPAIIDVFGSAPVPFGASSSELTTNIQLDENYLSENNPMDLIQLPGPINLHFFLEIGENDLSDRFGGNTIASVEAFINTLTTRSDPVPVAGGVIAAALASEPDNGNADHNAKFWRTRFGNILHFFSDIYVAE